MKEHYCTYEQAVALKRLGFSEMTYTHYKQDDSDVRYSEEAINWNNGSALFSAPRLDQAAAWMRDCKGVHVEPRFRYEGLFECVVLSQRLDVYNTIDGEFDSNESALSAGISAAFELLRKEVKE